MESLLHIRLWLSYGFMWQISTVYNSSTLTFQKCIVKDLTHNTSGWVTMKKLPTRFQLTKGVNKQHTQLQTAWNPINSRVTSQHVIGTGELIVKTTPLQIV